MLTVAIIDDESDICDVITEALEAPAVSVRRAATASLGTKMLTEEHFDIALIDVILPDASGIAVAEIALNKNIPVLLMTGDLSSIESLIQMKIPFLEKPFSLARLDLEAAQVMADSRHYIERARSSVSKLRATIKALDQTMKESTKLIEISRALLEKAATSQA